MSLPPELIERYVGHLRARREEVADLEAALRSGETDAQVQAQAQARETLRSLAHQLAGTAAGFGFPDVGAAARQLETALLSADPAVAEHIGGLSNALADAAQNRGG